MTIRVIATGSFHPPGLCNNRDCNDLVSLTYRCSRCSSRCLKCLVNQIVPQKPFARGCVEAQRAVDNPPTCFCMGCES